MKKTIKLRDLTEKQYKRWGYDNCYNQSCEKCPFRFVACRSAIAPWYDNKDKFTANFLDQTVEIEVPDLLTEEEKALLKDFDYFSLNSLTAIKIRLIGDSKLLTLYHGSDDFYVEFYVKNYLFKGLTEDNIYRVSDLGLEDK
jgi:hypothetical protein